MEVGRPGKDRHTRVDELHMALQVPINHEHLVAPGVRAGPLPNLLMMLLYVFLKTRTKGDSWGLL